MTRRPLAIVALAAIFSAHLIAHAGLRFSSPLEGVTLGDTPTIIQLALTERPEPALSEIHVIDRSGIGWDVGRPAPVPGDPLSLSIAVRPLGTGVYTVNWRVVSAVDGHATSGAYAFGVRASPTGVTPRNAPEGIPVLEAAARWILNVGFVLLLGAVFADLAGFGPDRPPLATAGWVLSAAGTILLLVAQQRAAGASFQSVLQTSVGRAIGWRAATIGLAGAALVVAWRSARSGPAKRTRLAGMTVAAVASFAAVAVHAAAGHAAADRELPLLNVAAQWAHVAAAGIWIGGLAAVLVATRGEPTDVKASSVHRFSTIAAAGLVVVLITGVVRAVFELSSWSDLTATAYGRTLLLKIGAFWIVALLGALNRLRSLAPARLDLAPLRKIGGAELGFSAVALGAAALLATFAPPASARRLPGIMASGVDFATTVRVTLSAVSNQPGPNRFVARIADYDSHTPVRADRVILHFTPLDDPGLPTTSLPLSAQPGDTYSGSGANLFLDGRWRVTVAVERGVSSVQVPLDVTVAGLPHPVSVERVPGRTIKYTVELRGAGFLRFSPDPERAGPSRLSVTCYDVIQDERRVQQMVVTLASEGNPARELPLRRVSAGTFVAEADFAAGRNTVAAVARTMDGTRLRASVDIDVPGR